MEMPGVLAYCVVVLVSSWCTAGRQVLSESKIVLSKFHEKYDGRHEIHEGNF